MHCEDILGLFGRDVIRATLKERTRLLAEAFAYWRHCGFPYPKLRPSEAEHEFRALGRVQPSAVIQGQRICSSTIGLRLANSFHPQIWGVPARRHLRSPLEYFQDDDILRKLLSRAVQFWPNRRCWNAQCLRSALRIYGGGRVSNFRPAAARAIISRYSRKGEAVLDFSAGFGGRLLGCLTLPRKYIAIDPATAQIVGLRDMRKRLSRFALSEVRIVQGCAEDIMPTLSPNSIDLVFSSPPYFNVEKYGLDETQSYRRYPNYETWKRNFLRPVIAASHKVLRRGGHLVINIANTQRHEIESDIRDTIRGFFQQREVLELLMHTRPLQRSSGTTAFRSEPVFVMRKTA